MRVEGQNNGSSIFHMAQFRVEKRYSSGLQVLANYAWSKMIERTRRLNPSDPFLEKRIANEDRPHRLVASLSYQLPFGRGTGGFSKRVIGGWVVNGIYTVQSGAPLNWEDRNVIYHGGDLQLQPRNIDRSFDRARFNTDPRQQLDRNRRTFSSQFNNLRTDRSDNVDLSVLKNIPIAETVALQLRGEAFNTFNRAAFNGPELNPANSNFGRITGQANLPRTIQVALRLKW